MLYSTYSWGLPDIWDIFYMANCEVYFRTENSLHAYLQDQFICVSDFLLYPFKCIVRVGHPLRSAEREINTGCKWKEGFQSLRGAELCVCVCGGWWLQSCFQLQLHNSPQFLFS